VPRIWKIHSFEVLGIHNCNPVVCCHSCPFVLLLLTLYLREIIKKRQKFKFLLDILELSEQISGCAVIWWVSALIAGILTGSACEVLTGKKAGHMVAVHMCKFTVVDIVFLFSHVLNHNYVLQNHQEKKRRRRYSEAWKKHQQVPHVKVSSIREQKVGRFMSLFFFVQSNTFLLCVFTRIFIKSMQSGKLPCHNQANFCT